MSAPKSNPFDALFADLANKTNDFANEPGEKAQAETSDRDAFVKKEKTKLLGNAMLTTLRSLLSRDDDKEDRTKAEIDMWKSMFMDDRRALEMIAMAHLYAVTDDKTIEAVVEARGKHLIQSSVDAEIERRWQAHVAASEAIGVAKDAKDS